MTVEHQVQAIIEADAFDARVPLAGLVGRVGGEFKLDEIGCRRAAYKPPLGSWGGLLPRGEKRKRCEIVRLC